MPRFVAILEAAGSGSATGIAVPAEVIEELAAGKRPAVRVTINGHAYRTTVGVMGGRQLIPVSAAVRAAAGVAAGDELEIEVVADASPRGVELPAELAVALAAAPDAAAFFATLPNGLQRYHADLVAGSAARETRLRRADRAIALFRAGRQR